jgi:hypothetical protein
MKSLKLFFCSALSAVNVLCGKCGFTQAEVEWVWGAGRDLISQNVSIKWPEKVESPAKSST